MSFKPRPYQVNAINAGVSYFNSNSTKHAFEILPTGSGKSVVIANIGTSVDEGVLVLQPSKEILIQNYNKFTIYGYRAGIYSASAGQKFIDKTTFATIGSIYKKPYLFKNKRKIIIDECHLVNPSEGIYRDFISAIPGAQCLGLTATPYRLVSGYDGAMLDFINRSKPKIFDKCLYYVQNKELFDSGHLAKLEYYSVDVINRSMLDINSSGTDFTDASLRAYYRQIGMPKITADYARYILSKKKNLLVFCGLIEEAEKVAKGIPGAVVITGETEQGKRDSILAQFKQGKIRCVINVGVLTTGFDYPELEAVLIARSTMSLALYYQIVGRAMRIHPSKENAWIVDLGGNINFFGKIETMEVKVCEKGLYSIWNNGRQLTNVSFTKN